MTAAADFLVQSADGTPQLVVEAKSRIAASPEWAARMRRNLFTHLALPHAPYFLLALPERFYLWKDAPPHLASPPDYEVDARQVLRPYLDKLQTPLSNLSENSFELLLRSWLEDLIVSNVDRTQMLQSDKWLIDSGLYDAIKQGIISTQGRP